tara:strand:+ start:495 stop:698 length:204 start_codon:yes stop_codon:yes gene_type:complete
MDKNKIKNPKGFSMKEIQKKLELGDEDMRKWVKRYLEYRGFQVFDDETIWYGSNHEKVDKSILTDES